MSVRCRWDGEIDKFYGEIIDARSMHTENELQFILNSNAINALWVCVCALLRMMHRKHTTNALDAFSGTDPYKRSCPHNQTL